MELTKKQKIPIKNSETMEAVTDPDRRARLLKLEERVFNPRDILNADCLLDAVQSMVYDSDHPTIKRMKNVEAFINRYAKVADEISRLRVKVDDFLVIKVIGRGAFGQVQLVRHKSTKKVYAMKLLSKFEMVINQIIQVRLLSFKCQLNIFPDKKIRFSILLGRTGHYGARQF